MATFKQKVFEGVVKSAKNQKTIVVSVSRKFKEERTGKIVSSRKNYMVHCEDETIVSGDQVQFLECRPYSKNKKWRFIKTLKKAEAAVSIGDA